MRPTWDEYWMDVARMIATRSTCLRRKIGAVITYNNHILSSGYNGSCHSLNNCSDQHTCLRDELQIPSGEQLHIDHAVHAEQNAIINSVFPLHLVPQNENPLTIYTTTYPCPICAKLIVQSRIRRVVCYSPYSNLTAIEIFAKSSVEVAWTNN